MPISFTVDPKAHSVEKLSANGDGRLTKEEHIKAACPNQAKICKELLQSSFSDGMGFVNGYMRIRRGGLVDVAVEAYNHHHHLVLRPDDVWVAILTQLSYYINAHAEELRSSFVSHEGKKTLKVEAAGTRYTVDFAKLSLQMTHNLYENITDPNICEWIMARFSTATELDSTIYAIQMMATMKKYFNYIFSLRCGLPGVTLEGTKHDWMNIYTRLDKLESFGPEPKQWAAMLRAVIKRFIRCFDVFSSPSDNSSTTTAESEIELEEEKKELRDFWSSIAHHSGGGSGPTYLSGWITAFCPWNAEGKWIDKTCAPGVQLPSSKSSPTPAQKSTKSQPQPQPHTGYPNPTHRSPKALRSSTHALTLDNAVFPIIKTGDVPSGYVEVDVVLDDNGQVFDTVMIAGHMGGRVVDATKNKLGVANGWAMFIKDAEKEQKEG